MREQRSLALAVFLATICGAFEAAADSKCKLFSKSGSPDAILADALATIVVEKACRRVVFPIKGKECDAKSITPNVEIEGQPRDKVADNAGCEAKNFAVNLHPTAFTKEDTKKDLLLKLLSEKDTLVQAKSKIPSAEPEDGRKEAEPSSNQGPIDVLPIACGGCKLDERSDEHARYIYVHEDLSVDPASAKNATDTQRIVIRFIARKSVACRYFAGSAETNEYKPEVISVGGGGGMSGLLGKLSKARLLSTEARSDKSCIGDNEADTYIARDFTFGPFTNTAVKINVFRRDVEFKGHDLDSTVVVANHRRYGGWFEVAMLGNWAPDRKSHAVISTPGSEITRIREANDPVQMDIGVLVRWYAKCDGGNNPIFRPVDLQTANVCGGLSSGISVRDPLTRIYPLGLHVTLGRFLGISGSVMLTRTKKLGDDWRDGQIFSGMKADLPLSDGLSWGAAIGIGLDPTVFTTLIAALISGQ